MKPIYLIFGACIISLSACNNTTGSGTEESSTAATPTVRLKPQSKLSETGTTLLMDVVDKYYVLKNALVATKAADAATAATQLVGVADSLNEYMKRDSASKISLNLQLDTIIKQSNLLATIADETCEKQRISFENISSAIYSMLKGADLKNGHVYHAFCPMAFNDKGAFWLSEESDIKNPYFGKKMLECGEVTDSM